MAVTPETDDEDAEVGAITITGTWRTTPGPHELWTVVDDLTSWPDWWPAIRAATPLDGGPGSLGGALLTFDTRPPLRPLVVTLEVVEREAPHLLVVEVTDGPLSGNGTLTVTDDPEGSSTHYDVQLRVRSLLFRPLESILSGATRSGGKARLARAGDDLAKLAGGELVEHRA